MADTSGMLGMIKDLVRQHYQTLLSQLANPPKSIYSVSELGPRSFEFDGEWIDRDDSSCLNERGLRLEYSVWRRRVERDGAQGIVIYVHDALDCRASVLDVLAPILAAGWRACSFDCTACGLSEGRHVTLGYFERYDVACIASALVERGQAPGARVGIVGRGSGAVAALLYADACEHNRCLKRRDQCLIEIECGPSVEPALDGAAFERGSRLYVVSKPPLVVASVASGSPAEEIGLRVGDVVAGVDDETRLPHSHDELLAAFAWRAAARRAARLRVARRHKLNSRDMEFAASRPLSCLVLDTPWTTLRALVWELVSRAMRDSGDDQGGSGLSFLWSPVVSAALSIVVHSIQKRSLADVASIDATRAARCAPSALPALFLTDREHPVLAASFVERVALAFNGRATTVDYRGPRSANAARHCDPAALLFNFDPAPPSASSRRPRGDDFTPCEEAAAIPLRSDEARLAIYRVLCQVGLDSRHPTTSLGSRESDSKSLDRFACRPYPWTEEIEMERAAAFGDRDLFLRSPDGSLISSRSGQITATDSHLPLDWFETSDALG